MAVGLTAVTMLLAGCASESIILAHTVKLVPETETIPGNQLLNVGVVVFDPGVPDGKLDLKVQEELIKDGTFVEVRRAESMYMPVELRDTLQNSGHWGSVWVIPKPTTAADLTVKTTILQSDGDIVALHVDAVDATGRTWIDKDYQIETAASSYNTHRYPNMDPYQDIFNKIANDLAAFQDHLPAADAKEIRRVAAMRYAGDLSPVAFGDYVTQNKDRFDLVRLPAANDPVYLRTQQARQREDLFLDTLNLHYTHFANEAQEPYHGWRESSREESIAIHELRKSARWRMGLGIASIVASVVYGGSGDNNFSDRLVRNALMYMGTDILQASMVRRQERKLHVESLQELSSSFKGTVQPLVVEVKGTEHRLTGTINAQYQEWRDLLRQIFMSETGLTPDDIEIREATPVTDPVDSVVPQAQTASTSDAAGTGTSGGSATAPSSSSGAATGSSRATTGPSSSGSATGSPSATTSSSASGAATGSSTAAAGSAQAPSGTGTESVQANQKAVATSGSSNKSAAATGSANGTQYH